MRRTQITARSSVDLIGETPLLELGRIYPGPGRILAKAEFLNPGGSIKDRAAKAIIEHARAEGQLAEGQPVVEMTSGNMGAGLAVVCAVQGHAFTAVMSEGNSPERARMLRGMGCEVVLVDQVDGTSGRVTGADVRRAAAQARKLAKERGAFYVDQFRNPASTLAHERGTGPEIWQQTAGQLDGFVTCVGSGGTFVGTSRFLKARRATVQCAAVEPSGARVLAGHPVEDARHVLQGTGYGVVPPHWEPQLADHLFAVSDADATKMRRALARAEGLYVGFSAAANVVAAIALASSGALGADPTVVTILCDSGLKY